MLSSVAARLNARAMSVALARLAPAFNLPHEAIKECHRWLKRQIDSHFFKSERLRF